MTQKSAPIYGHTIAPCRVTKAAVGVFLGRIALPFLLALACIDTLIWAIARYGFDACYGVWCWF